MDWKQYEKEIHAYFEETYKESRILYDQKIAGTYSKEDRQIDVLIEQYVAGRRIRIIVDYTAPLELDQFVE